MPGISSSHPTVDQRPDEDSVVFYEEIPCHISDVVTLFEGAAATRGWSVLHSDPQRERTIVGMTERPALSTSGAGRFEQAKARMQSVSSKFPEGVELPVAFCFAGFSAETFEQQSAWSGWPNLAVFIPDVFVVEDAAGVRAFKRAGDAPFTGALARVLAEGRSRSSGRHVRKNGHVGDNSATSGHELSGLLTDSGESRDAWVQLVESALSEIDSGAVNKLVPARERTISLETNRRWALATILAELRSGRTASTLYCVQSPDGRAFLGASPELLVRKNGENIESMALAGTAERRSDSDSHPSLHDEKNQREHRVVREEIVASLERSGARASAQATPETTDFGTIQHLKTVIRAVGERDIDVFDLVANLHPTPAVSGAPREVSQSWLAENESLERGYYSGPFGFIDSAGDGEFHVALRCALLDDSHAHIYAGAGVVAGSEPNAEWDETGWKLSTIAEVLVAEDVEP